MTYFLVAWVSGAAGILVGMFLFALFHEREQMRWWRRSRANKDQEFVHRFNLETFEWLDIEKDEKRADMEDTCSKST